MCNLFSCVMDKKGKIYIGSSGWMTSHTDIEAVNKLANDGKAELQRAKFEVNPPWRNYHKMQLLDLEGWEVEVDSDPSNFVKDRHIEQVRSLFKSWWEQQLVPVVERKYLVYSYGSILAMNRAFSWRHEHGFIMHCTNGHAYKKRRWLEQHINNGFTHNGKLYK